MGQWYQRRSTWGNHPDNPFQLTPYTASSRSLISIIPLLLEPLSTYTPLQDPSLSCPYQPSRCNSRTLSLAQPCCLPLLKPPWPLVPLPSSTTAVSPSTIRLSEVVPTQLWPNSRAATPRDTAVRAPVSRSSSRPMPLPTDPSPSSSSPGPTARSRTISQTSMATPSQLAVW